MGPQLIQIVAKDADSGVHLNRSSAFALLDLLMRFDVNHHYLNFIDRQSYLQNYIADFARQDHLLMYSFKFILFHLFFWIFFFYYSLFFILAYLL